MAVKKAEMMPTFAYDGVDRKGAKIKGELPAKNMAWQKSCCVSKVLRLKIFGKNVKIF